MKPFIELFGLTLPTYGLMILAGLIIINCIAFWQMRKASLEERIHFVLLEAYATLGATIGAKLLYIAIHAPKLEISRWPELFRLRHSENPLS